MDANLLESAQKIATELQNSNLYKEYKKNKEALENDPLLLERVRAFKKMQLEFESKRLTNSNLSFEEEKRIAHQYTELSLSPVAADFLSCEYELLDTYRQIVDTIYEGFTK